MKKSRVVGFVTGAHVVAFSGLLLTQGCGTTRAPLPRDEEFVMPPRVEDERLAPPVAVEPVYRPAPMPPVVQPVVVTEPSETTTYVVQKGDMLSVIAQRYGVTVQEIMRINQLSDPNVIRVGQRLQLPGSIELDQPRQVAPRAQSAAAPVTGGGERYIVQAGDSLSVIAQRYGVTVQALMRANSITNPDRVQVGQALMIPAEGRRPAPAPAVQESATPQPAVVAPVAPPVPAVRVERADAPVLPPAQAARSSQHTYTVEIGDDLLSVASEFNVSIAELRAANNLDSEILVPGRVLVIPAAE
jgi:LysM repeat protein